MLLIEPGPGGPAEVLQAHAAGPEDAPLDAFLHKSPHVRFVAVAAAQLVASGFDGVAGNQAFAGVAGDGGDRAPVGSHPVHDLGVEAGGVAAPGGWVFEHRPLKPEGAEDLRHRAGPARLLYGVSVEDDPGEMPLDQLPAADEVADVAFAADGPGERLRIAAGDHLDPGPSPGVLQVLGQLVVGVGVRPLELVPRNRLDIEGDPPFGPPLQRLDDVAP